MTNEQIISVLMTGIQEAVIVYDADFTIRVFNPRAEELFGMRAGDIIGTQFSLDTAQDARFHLLSPIMYASLAPTVSVVSEPGENPHIIKVILPNPSREFMVFTHQISDAYGDALGFVKIVRDMTREAELVQSKADFIMIAAHQLRTPATAIGWTFDNLEKDLTLAPETQEMVRAGKGAAQNLLTVIGNILNAAQIEEGRFGYQMESLELISFLDGLLAASMPIARHYNVNVYFERPPEPQIMVVADVQKLRLAVTNILDNALKYNVSGGQVVARIAVKDGMAEVSVRDTGMGISSDDLPKLFEKFFRTDRAKKTATEGSGLGLYLVKNIIEGHKGKVRAESTVGSGSTFYFTLPLAP